MKYHVIDETEDVRVVDGVGNKHDLKPPDIYFPAPGEEWPDAEEGGEPYGQSHFQCEDWSGSFEGTFDGSGEGIGEALGGLFGMLITAAITVVFLFLIGLALLGLLVYLICRLLSRKQKDNSDHNG